LTFSYISMVVVIYALYLICCFCPPFEFLPYNQKPLKLKSATQFLFRLSFFETIIT